MFGRGTMCQLRVLDVVCNAVQCSAVQYITARVERPQCKLEAEILGPRLRGGGDPRTVTLKAP